LGQAVGEHPHSQADINVGGHAPLTEEKDTDTVPADIANSKHVIFKKLLKARRSPLSRETRSRARESAPH
jgi:hypothetical protein